jgi:predicted permease
MGELWRRVWYLLNRSRFDRELREEMEAHRDMLNMTGTAGPRFGNTLRLREEARDAWGWTWLDRLAQDLRFAVRLLWRAPSFTITAIAVLAVGIGLNLAAFQVIDAVALSWLPVRSPETLVKIHRRSQRSTSTAFSYPAFDFYRRNAPALTSAIAVVSGSVTLGDERAPRVQAAFVTANYFSDLGASPLAGRLLDPRDEAPDAEAVIVLAERVWDSRFARDPSIVGRSVRVNGAPFTVAGVVAEAFVGIDEFSAGAWIPVVQHRVAFDGSTLLSDWSSAAVRFYGRPHDGAARAAVEAQLRPAVDALRAVRPSAAWDGEWLSLLPAGRFVTFAEAAPALALVSALVGLVLLSACMNLGLLVLARTLGRDREFAVRLSVGASRIRIVRQLLTEHLLLGLAGAAAGCFVAVQATGALVWLTGMPRGLAPHFNLRALAAAAVLAVLSSVVFGFAPAWQALRPQAFRRLRLRNVLLGVQVAAATVLLIVSGLLVRGVTRIVRVPLGFDYQQSLVADPGLESHGMTPAAAATYWRNTEARVRQIPGVEGTALTTLAPFGNKIWIDGARTVIYHVTSSYFDTMRIALKRGRVFADGERGVVVVGESLARRQWPGEDALGKEYDGRAVIGIAGDARTVRIGDGSTSECYRPMEAQYLAESVMVVRVAGKAAGAVSAVTAVLRADNQRLMPSVNTLEHAFETKLEGAREFALVASGLGICALLLAVTGFGGLVAFTVSQRLREIGVRVALGARPSHIVGAIGRQFRTPIACGAVAGSLLAAGVGTILGREMFGISRIDPVAYGGSLLLFSLVAALAAFPSIRRALRVDPIRTLRHE